MTFGLAVGALFLGAELNKETYIAPDQTSAASPLNCDLDKTRDNPMSDSNSGLEIPEYCPGTIGRFRVSTTGKLYLYLSRPDIDISINGKLYGNTDSFINTGLDITAGEYLAMSAKITDSSGYSIGWINPSGNMCGTPGWPAVSIQPLLDKVLADDYTVMERQCWGSIPSGTGDFAFNSFQIIIAIEPTDLGSDLNQIVTPSVEENLDEILATTEPTVEVFDNSVKVCGSSNLCTSDSNCTIGNTCFSVDNIKRCVANICLTNGQVNSICESDLCTPHERIDIEKTVSISCVSGQNKERLSYMIVLTNPGGNMNDRRNLTVVDTLDPQMQPSYVVRTSIPFGGAYANGQITWNNISLTPNGGRLEIRYDAIVPPSEYGKDYINNVVVTEAGVIRGSQTVRSRIEILPCTALISDKVDMLLLGAVLVIFGFAFYRVGVSEQIGNLLWNWFGVKSIAYKLGKDSKNPLFKKDKEEFENKIRKIKSRK